MACEWEEYAAKLSEMGYGEYDNETLIRSRVREFADHVTLNTLVATLEIGMGLCCVMCNVLVLQYYVQRIKEQIPLLYSALLIVDLIAGVGSVLQGITLLLLTHNPSTIPHYFWYLSPLTYTLYSLAAHTSVFYSTLLVTVRTLAITRPHARARVSCTLVALLVCYPVVWLVVILWEVWIECVYWEDNTLPMIVDLFVIIPTTLGSLDYYLGYILTCEPVSTFTSSLLSHLLPFGLPSVVSLAATIVQVITLSHISTTGTKYRRVTVTILILTSIFLVCNTAQVVTVVTIDSLNLEYTATRYYAHYLVATVLPVLNSLLNPVVLLARGSVFSGRISLRSTFSMRQSVMEK